MHPAALDPERWNRLSDLFADALELPEPERSARLADPSLDEADRRALAELLAAHFGGAPLGIERWVADEASAAGAAGAAGAAEPATDGAGGQIGPYRLIERLGEGGMGEVWLAVRDAPGLDRPVALKRLRAGLRSEEHRRRFAVEREALGRLSHRGIALLLDGGIDAEGVPYLVLEHVSGLPITEACDARRLPLARRLELFAEVCDAVQYAHAQLIVHRDLKPSNILVNDQGEVRLLDFGIAKLLDPESDLGVTRTALRLATPEYASPEQLEGAAVSTATDVFALGVLLCELLTGRRPFADREGSARELDQAIRTAEPPRPSELVASSATGAAAGRAAAAARGTTADGLAAALRGDLDTIVLKALQKEPGRRYGSVEQLAGDVRRYLAGLPILARPDTAGYRLRKFVGRHRTSAAAVAAAVVLLLAFLAYAVHQSGVVARERDAARAERDKAREVSAFLVDLFAADPYAYEGLRDSTPLGELLERSEASVRRELAGRPELRAMLLARLARLHGNLGRLERARALAEEAVALERAQPVEDSAELAESVTTLATVLQEQGEYGAAETLFTEALALREALYGERHPAVAESVHNLAVLLATARDPERLGDLERLARRGLALRRELLGDRDPVIADSLNLVGFLLFERRAPGDLEEAERMFGEVLEIRRRELGPEHPAVATALNNLANLLDEAGREDEAVPLFRQAIGIWRASLGAEHPRVAVGLYGLAEALADAGDPAAAEEALRASIAIDERALPPGHPYLEGSYQLLDRLLAAQGRTEPAGR